MSAAEKGVEVYELLMDYESGLLDEEQTLYLFQTLLDTGWIYSLQGSYQRTAKELIDLDLIHAPLTQE